MKSRAKNRRKWLLIPALTVVLVIALAGVALAGGASHGSDRAQGGISSGTAAGGALLPLADAEQAHLLFLLEEEKLARDVYESFYETWGAAEFSKIAVSEQQHTDSVLKLVEKYGLDAPSTLNDRGQFDNDNLQNLYKDLIAQGAVSLQAAYKVGIAIEEYDIEDLQTLLASTNPQHTDILRVANNLLRASNNHLAAFSSLVED